MPLRLQWWRRTVSSLSFFFYLTELLWLGCFAACRLLNFKFVIVTSFSLLTNYVEVVRRHVVGLAEPRSS